MELLSTHVHVQMAIMVQAVMSILMTVHLIPAEMEALVRSEKLMACSLFTMFAHA